MPFRYDRSPTAGGLLQGEILSPIIEYRPDLPPVDAPPDREVPVTPVRHEMMIVMTAVCDLEQDYKRREQLQRESENQTNIMPDHPHLVPHVLLCDVFRRQDIRARFTSLTLWQRIEQNQDERYHRFPATSVGGSDSSQIPEVFLDFKKSLAIPTELLYQGVNSGRIHRLAVVPSVYLHDLIHRYYSFLSRVGLPE